MNLINIYKKSLLTTFSNPSITLFLVLFLIASNLMTSYMQASYSNSVATILFFCITMLSVCFVSGWSLVIKDVSSEEKKENKNYFGIFFEGIGKNIISVGIGCFIYTFLLVVVFVITGKIAHETFGSLSFIQSDLANLPQDNKAIIDYFTNLSSEKEFIITSWILSLFLATTIFNFVTLFYYPAIIYSNLKNEFAKPFVALKDSIVFLFKNFFASLLIYFSILFIYFLIMFLNANFSANSAISIIVLLFYIYFISFTLMLTFNYYGQRNNCNNRADSIGQNEDCDKSSEIN